jgi:ABC-type multidrug transport system ATPase subunit/pSer/pThr/pTyr-binding forkhead associated (FHA) protein
MTDGTLFLRLTQLKVSWPDGTQDTVYLEDDIVRVGRAGDCHLTVPENFSSISRHHFEIRKEGGKFFLRDLDSANGVWVNRTKLSSKYLEDGDLITIGLEEHDQLVKLVFQLGNEDLFQLSTLPAKIDLFDADKYLDAPPVDLPYLKIHWPNGKIHYFPVAEETLLVGRDQDADVGIPGQYQFVSSKHFIVQKFDDQFTITDLNSTNGTYLNNKLLDPESPSTLHTNSIIRLGDDRFGISIGITFNNPQDDQVPDYGFIVSAATVSIEAVKEISIGRLLDNDIHLDAPDISRRHAKIIAVEEDGFYIQDLDSRNGTYVNNELVKNKQLQEDDLIRIGSYLLTFSEGNITPYQSNGVRIDIEDLSFDYHHRDGDRRVIYNVSFSVLPREFVAIVGGSGAGKTTLLNALIGVRPGIGKVKLNGHDFYEEYEHFRSQLGYVPQNDILHTSLTVEKALEYTAKLRLPASVGEEEREKRIAAVLETVSMNTKIIRGNRIGNLSGGQRKRVSIAAELLADPKLIYLDEATSGLDPGLEKKMMHTLRRMADEGRTVMLITHATGNIVQTDHVAFISQGRLVYFGPSQEALDFFEVGEFADIYGKIQQSGEAWQDVYQTQKTRQYSQYVKTRLLNAKAIPKLALPKERFDLGDFFRQMGVLTQRSLNVLLSAPTTLILMLLLLPLTGVLQLIIGSSDILTGDLSIIADPVEAAKTIGENYSPFPRLNTFIFVMGLEAVLTGLFVPSNDFVKERSVYLRERMVNLRVLPYLFSKVVIYSIFVVIQVALYLVILSFGIEFPREGYYFSGSIELFITLFLTMMAGITFGFIVSAVSKSTEMAIYILTLLLFFQFFFSGTVFDLRENTFEPFSYLTTTRWSLTALGVTVDMPEIVESTIICTEMPQNPLDPGSGLETVCTNFAEAQDSMMLNYEPEMLVRSWLVLIGMSLGFIAITGVLLKNTRA